ncbi:ATP-binding protein [Streptomyces sp. NPDC055749]
MSETTATGSPDQPGEVSVTSYDASHIHVLHGVEAMRKRPGMWIGSTGIRGLHLMVYETVARSVDEVLADHADRVDVTLTADGGVRVADNGCGIPVAVEESTGPSAVETVLTLPDPGKRSGAGSTVSSGISGVGMSVVNALSSRLTVEVRRDGFRWSQEYERGVPVAPPAKHEATTAHGTAITFWADESIFETTRYETATLWQRFQELAFLTEGLTISLTDERTQRTGGGETEQGTVRMVCEGGLRDFVTHLNSPEEGQAHTGIITFEEENQEETISVAVAMQWTTSPQDRVRTFANTHRTYEGGTHEQGFLTALAALITTYARERRLLPEPGGGLSGDDVRAGLTAIVSVNLRDPQFEGSTRTRLANADVHTYVQNVVREHLTDWLDSNPTEAEAAMRRAVGTAIASRNGS